MTGRLSKQQTLCQHGCADRIGGHRIGPDLSHKMRASEKQRPADDDGDRWIERRGPRHLDRPTQRFDTGFGAEGESRDGEPRLRHILCDVARARFLA